MNFVIKYCAQSMTDNTRRYLKKMSFLRELQIKLIIYNQKHHFVLYSILHYVPEIVYLDK